MSMNAEISHIVIIGGAACGPKAAARARRRDPRANITLIERGEELSYAGCGLPYYIGGAVSDITNLRKTAFDVIRDEEYFRNVKNINVRLQTEAVKIDRTKRTIAVRSIASEIVEDIPYDKLVLATGSIPFIPPIKGISQKGIYGLHLPEDAVQIREKIENDEVDRVVVIGAGLIGLELVESFFNHAVDVTVLELADAVLPSCLDPDMALYLKNEVVRDGVEIFTHRRIDRIDLDNGSVRVIAQDHSFPADMVIIAAGNRPNVSLAKEAGLHIGETGAISVNPQMQTSDPNIYAGGDCVECRDLVSGRMIYAPLGSTANKQGRIIGDNITGGWDEFDGVVGTIIFKVLNLTVAKTGLTEQAARACGFRVATSLTPCLDHVHFYPGGKSLMIKLIADRDSGRLLGAQIIGSGDAAKRIDVLATTLQNQMTLHDVANLDLGYSPPYSHAMECVIQAANHVRNRIDGAAHGISADQVQQKLLHNDILLLDVREQKEFEKNPILSDSVKNIPLTSLRYRLDEIPNNKLIVCCCTQGTRSYEACLILQASRFDSVYYLDGGLRIWMNASRIKGNAMYNDLVDRNG